MARGMWHVACGSRPTAHGGWLAAPNAMEGSSTGVASLASLASLVSLARRGTRHKGVWARVAASSGHDGREAPAKWSYCKCTSPCFRTDTKSGASGSCRRRRGSRGGEGCFWSCNTRATKTLFLSLGERWRRTAVKMGAGDGPGDQADRASARWIKVCSLRGGARRSARDPSRPLSSPRRAYGIACESEVTNTYVSRTTWTEQMN